ncbi:MAG TPA: FtsW/RodA/SpoVE family cell cycle protein, partial [Candidatus Dormibacteraeota bacterium]|nr:FtsW/RodA/SpoVE family cell cycle protein [Candidatus Dormibacteraeota bacterium]
MTLARTRLRSSGSAGAPARLGPLWRAATPSLDPWLLGALLVLSGLGVANLLALGERSAALHQAAVVAVGFGGLVVAWRLRSQSWPWFGRAVYALAVLMLLVVAVVGAHAYGARRWLAVGSVYFQPSELAELGLLLVLAEVLSSTRWGPRRRVACALSLAAVPVALTLTEPDLSTAALLVILSGGALVLARVSWRLLGSLLAVGLALVPLGLHLLRPYQLARLHGFLGGGGGAATAAGWTTLQAHIAIASGGLLGVARSHALVTQLLATYLPARETDLAFASLTEEWGLLAAAVLLVAVAVLIWRLVAAAIQARTDYAALIAGGLAVLVGAEVAISVAGNLGLIPLAGIPIPLVSSGGTVAVAQLAAVGFVQGARWDASRRRLWRVPRGLAWNPRLSRGLSLLLALAILGLGGLTYRLQRQHGVQLRAAARSELTRWVPLVPARGAIVDRHGVVLAESVPRDQIVAIPGILTQHPAAESRLAALLQRPLGRLQRALAVVPPAGGLTVTLAAAAPVARGAAIQAAHLPGVLVEPTQGRVYPFGSLLGPILGYTGIETAQDVPRLGLLPPGTIIGRAGLELAYDRSLGGRYGSQGVLVTPAGWPVAMGRTIPPRNGAVLQTSLDLGLQQVATRALAQAISGAFPGSQRGDQGAAVVLDPQNGQILAMASLPAYNDSLFGPPVRVAGVRAMLLQGGSPLLEHATQTVMPPGSVFKLVVAAADTASHTVDPYAVLPTGYWYTYDGAAYHSWTTLPPQNLPQSIAWSNDVYFYKLAVALGADRIIHTAQQLGVGQPTGIDLPGESSGFLGTPTSVRRLGATWYPGSTVILGIGQGYLTATPLQVARWTAAVATGRLVTPRLGLAQGGPGGSLTPLPAGRPRRLPFAATLGPVRQGLRWAVTQGTASMLAGLGIDAGGKTGTAQDPSAPHGGPDAWFTAVAPMRHPQVVVTVLVRGGGEGYYSSQPAAKEILRYFFAHERAILSVSGGRPGPGAAAPPAAPRAVRCQLPAGDEMTVALYQYLRQ